MRITRPDGPGIRRFTEGSEPHMAVEVGQKAPDFTLPSSADEPVTLSEVIKEGHAVLAFYHFAFTGG